MKIDPGTRLGPYEILGLLAHGGMGEVYRARDARLSRDVAIKILPDEYSADRDRMRRFEQEARSTGMLNHPNILSVFDFGTQNGSTYIVSELLEGQTLREILKESRLSQRKALDYGLQIVNGLAAAHEKGIIHRDLKPENLFVTKDGRVKILDFGLAKLKQPDIPQEPLTQAPTMTKNTAEGVVFGTIGYMSPEQVRASAIDHRSDLFTFGAILFEMLTAKGAFVRQNKYETLNAILNEDPFESFEIGTFLNPALQAIIRHCLEKNPSERFQSARDLAFHLQTISTSNTTGSLLLPESKKTKRFNLSQILALAIPFAIAIGFLIGRQFTGSLSKPSDPAGVVFSHGNPVITPDGKFYTHAYLRILGDLYLANGLQ
jgi:eukaryotic-like serine/threonine-protein kinase